MTTEEAATPGGPRVTPAVQVFTADNFNSPTTAFIKVGAPGTEVELPIKDCTLKRTASRVSVKNHKTRGHPLTVLGGWSGTVEFRKPVATGAYTLTVGAVYSLIFGYTETETYTVGIAITDISDAIPDPDGEDPPMYSISAILEGQITELGTL
jgi:hypothetical protein